MKTLTRFPLGLVVHDTDGNPWLYIGYTITTVNSQNHRFVRTFEGWWPGPVWQYAAVKRDTLIKKFPDLAEHWPAPDAPISEPMSEADAAGVDWEKVKMYENDPEFGT